MRVRSTNTGPMVPRRDHAVARQRMYQAVRAQLQSGGYLEVETPIVVPSPGIETHLFAYETEAIGPDLTRVKRYLHTSPEYAMKRMLAAGYGSIFQLARVFRNEERSHTHTPEFTMLEFYRSPGTLDDVVQDTVQLIHHVADAVGGPWAPRDVEEISVSALFREAGLPDPLAHPEVEDFRAALGLRSAPDDTWSDLFHRGFFEASEKRMRASVTVLSGYPAQLSALARLDPQNPKRALRSEIFLGRLELANGYDELTDVAEQRRRFAQDHAERKKLGRPVYPIDEALLNALPQIPPSGGIAVGLDRLLMSCLGEESLSPLVFS